MALSKETSKIIAKNISGHADEIIQSEINKGTLENEILSRYAFIFGFIGPVLALFQISSIFFRQSAAGVSLIYWLGYLAVASMWFGYGIFTKDKKLLSVYGAWMLSEIIIINLVLFY